MSRKALLVSPELCIGCRACQTACKSWKQLPAEQTKNDGTFENPPALSKDTFNRIRFVEIPSEKDPMRWLFVSERCMHCEDAGCEKVCHAPGAITKTKDGCVQVNKDKCIACGLCVSACPFNVPKYDDDGKMAKCDLCAERTANGEQSACAKVCPTGAIKFGDRDKLLAEAKKGGFGSLWGENDLGGQGVLYAFKDAPKLYGLDENPTIPASIVFWHNVLKPVTYLGFGGAVVASMFHYMIFGRAKNLAEANSAAQKDGEV